jgi:hypothetical protein
MSFANFTREIPDGIHQRKATLKWLEIENAFENFTFKNFVTWAGRS